MRTAPWEETPARVREVMAALRFRYHKWDLFAGGGLRVVPESILLAPEEHAEVVRIAEALAAALARLETAVLDDASALAALAIPPAVLPLVRASREGPTLARTDLFRTPDGRWLASEFNEDVPGGFNEAAGVPALLGGAGFAGDLGASVAASFAGARRVAVLYATGYSEDLQHAAIVEDWLAAAGIETVRASPANLEVRWGRPRVLGRAVDAAFRIYPGEWFARLPNLAAWLRAAPALRMMNPLARLARQSKRLFALWRLRPDLLSEADRRLLEAHTPCTDLFRVEDAGRLRAERTRWVLKRAFGRMGDTVTIGALVDEDAWGAALAEACLSPDEWIVQERFEVEPLPFAAGPMYPAVGVFLVDGRFAGYFSRAAAEPLLTHRASHVATVISVS